MSLVPPQSPLPMSSHMSSDMGTHAPPPPGHQTQCHHLYHASISCPVPTRRFRCHTGKNNKRPALDVLSDEALLELSFCQAAFPERSSRILFCLEKRKKRKKKRARPTELCRMVTFLVFFLFLFSLAHRILWIFTEPGTPNEKLGRS